MATPRTDARHPTYLPPPVQPPQCAFARFSPWFPARDRKTYPLPAPETMQGGDMLSRGVMFSYKGMSIRGDTYVWPPGFALSCTQFVRKRCRKRRGGIHVILSSALSPYRILPNGPRSCGWGRTGRCLPHRPHGQPVRQQRFRRVQVRCFRGRCHPACFPSRGR